MIRTNSKTYRSVKREQQAVWILKKYHTAHNTGALFLKDILKYLPTDTIVFPAMPIIYYG